MKCNSLKYRDIWSICQNTPYMIHETNKCVISTANFHCCLSKYTVLYYMYLCTMDGAIVTFNHYYTSNNITWTVLIILHICYKKTIAELGSSILFIFSINYTFWQVGVFKKYVAVCHSWYITPNFKLKPSSNYTLNTNSLCYLIYITPSAIFSWTTNTITAK